MYIQDIEEDRKWTTLAIVGTISTVLQLFYLLRYNFYHNFSEANYYTIPGLFLSSLSLYFALKKKYILTSLLIIIPSTVNLFFMLAFAGGIHAPGVFWAYLLPLYYGAFFKKKGALLGFLAVFLFLVLFYLLDASFKAQFLLENFDVEKERLPNLILMGIVFSSCYYFVLKHYEISSNKLLQANFKSETLLRVVLHDLSNHMTSISHRIKRLSREDEYFLKLGRSAKRSVEIISTVRKLQQADFKLIEQESKEEDIKGIVGDLVEDYQEQLQGKGIELKLAFETSRTSFICNRNILINEVLGNILSNAIKFSYPGSKLKLKVFDELSYVVFHIEDEGIGMPEQIRKGLFIFGEATSRKGTAGEFGTGYGLPIMSFFVKAMNGKVEVTSKENVGTIFKVYI